jgi:hypothetical protein
MCRPDRLACQAGTKLGDYATTMYGVSHGADVSRMSAVRRMLIFFIEVVVFMAVS